MEPIRKPRYYIETGQGGFGVVKCDDKILPCVTGVDITIRVGQPTLATIHIDGIDFNVEASECEVVQD